MLHFLPPSQPVSIDWDVVLMLTVKVKRVVLIFGLWIGCGCVSKCDCERSCEVETKPLLAHPRRGPTVRPSDLPTKEARAIRGCVNSIRLERFLCIVDAEGQPILVLLNRNKRLLSHLDRGHQSRSSHVSYIAQSETPRATWKDEEASSQPHAKRKTCKSVFFSRVSSLLFRRVVTLTRCCMSMVSLPQPASPVSFAPTFSTQNQSPLSITFRTG